jgi:hypothetical protein
MARPVYIICSLSGSEDKRTGLLSHFNVIEKLQIIAIPIKPDDKVQAPSITFRMVAVWMRGDEDTNQEFEYEVVALMPPENKEVHGTKGKFVFEKPLQRLTVEFIGSPPFAGAGIMYIGPSGFGVGTPRCSG